MEQEKNSVSENDSVNRSVSAPLLVVISFLAVVFSIFSAGGPYNLFGLVFFAISSALMAFVYSAVDKWWVWMIFLIPSVFSAFVFQLSAAIWTLFSVLLGVTVSGGSKKEKSKSVNILICTVVVLVGALCYFIGEAAASGTVTVQSVISQITKPFDILRELVIETGERMVNAGYEDYRIDPDLLDSLFSQIALYSLSIAVCIAMSVSWLASTAWSGLNKRFNSEKYIRDWHVKASVISAAVYIFSFVAVFLCSSFETDAMTIAGIAFSNLTTMLTPCFAVIGIRSAVLLIKNSQLNNVYSFYLVFTVLLFAFMPSVCVSMYSVIGLLNTFRENFAEKKK